MDPRPDPPWLSDAAVRQAAVIVGSLRRLTGRALVPDGLLPAETARRLFEAPCVVVSHGTGTDPVLNYGNAVALRLWETCWEDLVRMPSRLTAEAPEREERARLLATVARQGYIDDYSGVRISTRGRRFRIRAATVWNLATEDGVPCGQAAMFSDWEFLAG